MAQLEPHTAREGQLSMEKGSVGGTGTAELGISSPGLSLGVPSQEFRGSMRITKTGT